ncbi:hypothetical protein [Streptomyces mutabilis]|nr:hypothetical protein [Streptomyces mutabilis]
MRARPPAEVAGKNDRHSPCHEDTTSDGTTVSVREAPGRLSLVNV